MLCQKSYVEALTPSIPQKVTPFGDRTFEEVTKLKQGEQMGLNSTDRCPYKNQILRHTKRQWEYAHVEERPFEGGDSVTICK